MLKSHLRIEYSSRTRCSEGQPPSSVSDSGLKTQATPAFEASSRTISLSAFQPFSIHCTSTASLLMSVWRLDLKIHKSQVTSHKYQVLSNTSPAGRIRCGSEVCQTGGSGTWVYSDEALDRFATTPRQVVRTGQIFGQYCTKRVAATPLSTGLRESRNCVVFLSMPRSKHSRNTSQATARCLIEGGSCALNSAAQSAAEAKFGD